MQAKGANPPLWQDTSLRHCQCFLVWIGLLFNPTHKQLQGKKRSDRETPIDLIAYLRGCKLIFACAIKWLAPGEGVARLLGELGLHLDFAVSIPLPEGDCEFVRRLQAVDPRLKRLSRSVLLHMSFFRGFS